MASKRKRSAEHTQTSRKLSMAAVDLNTNSEVFDGALAARASPDVDISTPKEKRVKQENIEDANFVLDPESEADRVEDQGQFHIAASRPPAVDSDYLPLPWKGRLGYACLNTYLRYSNPPVFSSRTCRIASIEEHCHLLKDPSQPEHFTKNRPNKDKLKERSVGSEVGRKPWSH
jgi:hypothetical protein